MSDTVYWRNVANEGRGSTMTACLHEACDEIDRLERELAAVTEERDRLRADAERFAFWRDNGFCYYADNNEWILTDRAGNVVRRGKAKTLTAAIDAARKAPK